MKPILGIIGGSGLYSLDGLKNTASKYKNTLWYYFFKLYVSNYKS